MVSTGEPGDGAHPERAEAGSRRFRRPGFRLRFLRRRPGGRGRSRSPNSRATAGSSVSAMTTAIVTAAAAARPITVSTGIFATESPASAITTVAPAKTTALPAVARARDIASVGVESLAEVASMSRQDEQRVVDADGQARASPPGSGRCSTPWRATRPATTELRVTPTPISDDTIGMPAGEQRRRR